MTELRNQGPSNIVLYQREKEKMLKPNFEILILTLIFLSHTTTGKAPYFITHGIRKYIT